MSQVSVPELETENVTLQIRSNLIGIFSLNFHTKHGPVQDQVEVVVGRIKVKENILVNVALSGGIGLAPHRLPAAAHVCRVVPSIPSAYQKFCCMYVGGLAAVILRKSFYSHRFFTENFS